MQFTSAFEKLSTIDLPDFSDTRIMMMPIILGDINSITDKLSHYKETMQQLFDLQNHDGEVGYITIDEKKIMPQNTHRRAGIHVDGIYKGNAGSWGGGGSWGGVINPQPMPPGLNLYEKGQNGPGFITVSSHKACRAWDQDFQGWPGDEGECEHLSDQCLESKKHTLEENTAYWLDPLCVHESMPVGEEIDRQFIRLSLPSEAP